MRLRCGWKGPERGGWWRPSGFFAPLRMTAETHNGKNNRSGGWVMIYIPPIAKVRDRWAPGDLWRPGKNRRRTLPVGEGAVEFAGDGEIGALVGEFGGEGFVDVDAEAGSVAGVHVAGVEGVVVGEDFVGEFRVVHVLLD